MTTLVTGAAGRVGANVVRRLVAAGIDVKAMVMPEDPQAAKLRAFRDVEIVEADLRDQVSINGACRGVDRVIHLAAQLIRGSTPVDAFYDINAFGTLRLLEGVLQSDTPIERFVLASTDGVYRPGDPPAWPTSEGMLTEPADYYGTSKLLSETILRNHGAQYGIPFSVLRFASVISPEESVHLFRLGMWRDLLGRASLGKDSNLWPLFEKQPDLLGVLNAAVGDASDDAAVSLVGPDGSYWSLHVLDVRDAVQSVYLALTEPVGGDGRVFNVGAAKTTSTEESAAIIAEMFGTAQIKVAMPMTWPHADSIEAARSALRYRPAHDFRSMLQTATAPPSSDSDDAYIPARI